MKISDLIKIINIIGEANSDWAYEFKDMVVRVEAFPQLFTYKEKVLELVQEEDFFIIQYYDGSWRRITKSTTIHIIGEAYTARRAIYLDCNCSQLTVINILNEITVTTEREVPPL